MFVQKLCVHVCLLVFGLTAVLDELKHTEILQMFAATSDSTNQNYTHINVSFLQVHEQQHVLVVSVHLELKVSVLICASPLISFLLVPL